MSYVNKPAIYLIGIFIIFLSLSLNSANAQTGEDPEDLELANEYIRMIVNTSPFNTGRFSISTTGGDPDRDSDRNKHLIYGGSEPWASFTTIRVGNKDYVFGGPTNKRAGADGEYGTVIQEPEIVDNSIVTAYKTGPIEVSQILSFARSTTTGLMDTVKIEYQLHNTDDITHMTGLRIMLDTMLGENDGAPFRVDDQALLTDAVFYADEMPEFWQAFDSLSEPQVMSQGTLSGDKVTTPNRVYFTNWGSLADEVWNFDFQPGRDYTREGEFELDSALALFWDPSPLKPGETRNYVTYYGLGGVTIAPGDLSLGVTSPAQVTADSTHRQSFPIVAYIQNTGRGEARNLTANIKLPEGLQLLEGEAHHQLRDLDANDTIQTSWQVIPTGDISGELTYEVNVDAINSEANTVRRAIEIVTPAKIQAELRGPLSLSVESERLIPYPMKVTAFLKNIGGARAHNVALMLEHPVGLQLASGDRTHKYPGSLAPEEEIQINWYLEPEYISGNLPYSLKIRSSAGEQVVNNFVLIPKLDPKVWVGEPLIYGGENIQPGDYFSVSFWATNIRNLQKAELDVAFNSDVIEIVGKTLDISKGTLFIDDSREFNKEISWTMPEINNQKGEILGLVGERGETNAIERAFGTLVTIHFRAKSPGDAQISFLNVNLYDSDNNLINVYKEEQSIQVEY